MKRKSLIFGALVFLISIHSILPLFSQELLPRGISPDGPIFDMQRKGKKLYIAGNFNKVGYVTGGSALFEPGSDIPNLDFPHIFGRVYDAIPDGNGGWFVGGDFSSVNDFDLPNLVHILPDMSWDDDFRPDPNSRVNALALHGEILYVGGNFSSTAGTSGAYLVAYNTVNKSVSTVSFQPDGEVMDLLVYDNHLIIAGRFRNIGGLGQRGLAKIDLSTGNRVPFPYLSASAALALLVHNNILYVGGDFNAQVVSNAVPYTRNRVFAVDLVQNEVTSWAPNVGGSGFVHRVNDLEVIDSLIYLGGSFNAVNGEPRSRLAAVSVSGNLAPFKPDPDDEIFALRAYKGNLLAGGEFLTIASTAQSFSALLDVSTGQLVDWNIAPDWAVRSFTLLNDQILVGGEFKILKGVERDNACAFDLTTGELMDWNPQGGFLVGSGLLHDLFQNVVFLFGWDSNNLLNIKGFHSETGERLAQFNIQADNSVNQIIQDPKTGNIYFCGDFQTINGQARKRMAAMDRNGNLLDFQVDIDGPVYSMAILDSVIYFGGRINNVNSEARFKLAAVNLKGELQPWYPQHNILLQTLSINIVEAFHDKVIISGGFSTIGTEERNRLAAVHPVTGDPLPWNPNADINSFSSFKTESDGIFIAGNGFQQVNGILVHNLAYVSLNTALPMMVFPDMGVFNVFTMETYDTILYIAGDFRNLEGGYHPFFAKVPFTQGKFVFTGNIDSFGPRVGGNTGDVGFEVVGSGLVKGSRVSLGKDGIEEISPIAGSTYITNETKLNTIFDLRGISPGKRDVIIEVPGDTTYVFDNVFELVQGKGPLPWAGMMVPPFIRTQREEIIFLTYGNSGDIDAEGVPLWLSISPNIEVLNFGMQIVDFMDPDSEYYDSIPEYVLIDTLLGEPYKAKIYSFFIPRIPAGSSKTIPISVKGLTDGDFYTRAWTNEPYFGSPLKYLAGDCFDAIYGAVLNFVPGAGCIYGIMDISLSPFVDPIYDPEFGSSAYVGNYFQTVAETAIGCALDATTGGVGRVVVEVIDYAVKGKSIKNAYDKCQTPEEGDDTKGQFVASHDPNDKTGPEGQGSQGWLTTRRKFPYMIRFENQPEATAPANRVIIRDTLDLTVFNPQSLELKSFAIGGKVFDIPSGRKEYSDIIDLRPGVNSLVKLDVRMDPISGELVWEFNGLDPQTFLPHSNPLEGFLPPNADFQSGQGSVVFDLGVYDTITTGREIANKAAIYFDYNEPIITNTWSLRADNHFPGSHVLALPDTQYQSNFTVSWEGSDTGSGIRYYDILFRENEGQWKYAAVQAKGTSVEFTGEPGKKYEFQAVAMDTALNREISFPIAEASTFIAQGAALGNRPLEAGKVKISPNPAYEELFVEMAGFPGTIELRVMDLSGRIMYDRKFVSPEGIFIIPLENFSKGFYILEWRSVHGTGGMRFIKQ